VSAGRGACAALAALALAASGCDFARIARYGPSEVTDWRIFPSRPLRASPSPRPLPQAPGDLRLPAGLAAAPGGGDLRAWLAANDTLAFLVLRDGRLVVEEYWNGHARESLSLSFSMAKSFTSILVGLALEDGLLRSVEQEVVEIVPELASRGWRGVRLRHLLEMTSGSGSGTRSGWSTAARGRSTASPTGSRRRSAASRRARATSRRSASCT
jgi:CubicO group peptidase (beta-lactamase class C family)